MLDRGRLPAAGRFGSGAAALCRREVEVGQLVVEQEPATRDDNPTATELLDRVRVRHDIPPPVADHEVVGVRTVVARLRVRGGQRACRRAIQITGRNRTRQRMRRVDQASPLLGEPIGQQRLLRDVDERRIADVPVAVGEGQPCRLEVVM
jgi:hypothetical protein